MASGESPYVCLLDKNIQELASNELGETEETRNSALAKMREWLKENPDVVARTGEIVFIIRHVFNSGKSKYKEGIIMQ